MSKDNLDVVLTAYVLCKNKLAKKYTLTASRKFIIGDETYVIKRECCYPRIYNGQLQMIAIYSEGNPNPFDLRNTNENKGLNSKELNHYIEGDVNNIIVECQKKDKTRHIMMISVVMLILGVAQFIGGLIFG